MRYDCEMHDTEGEDVAVHRIAALLRKDATEVVDVGRDAVAWRELLERSHRDDEAAVHRRAPRWWLLVPAVGSLLLLVIGLVRAIALHDKLRCEVDGGAITGGSIASDEDQTRHVDFSEGSSFVLHPKGRLRVTNTDPHGAVLALEHGRLDVSIVHRTATRWRIDAGPFAVHVTGTRFVLTWEPDAGDMDLDLLDGAVRVDVPGTDAPVEVHAGQRFHGNRSEHYTVARQSLAVSAVTPSPVRTVAPSAQDAPCPAPKATRTAADPSSPSEALPPEPDKRCGWGPLVANGQFDTAVLRARRMGVHAALAECSVRSLFDLADAARYSGAFDLGQQALTAIRQRSPSDAGKAAFFLGRLEEARGNQQSALIWYTRAIQGTIDPQFLIEAKAGRERLSKRAVPASVPPRTYGSP